mgnify:CR=1 FL=1
MKKNNFLFSEVVNLSLREIMSKYKNTTLFGLGVDDPKGIFGTTIGLEKKYGKERVFDVIM